MKITKSLCYIMLLIAAALLPVVTEAYFISVAITILTFMTLSISWDMMLRTGQLSFGTAGFSDSVVIRVSLQSLTSVWTHL